MGIAFAGTAPFGEAILRGLVAARDDVLLVISQPDRPAGRGRSLRSPHVAVAARELGIPLLQPERAHDPDVLAKLEGLGITTIVVAAFGQMIREPLLSDYLLLNVHGSLLPAYRGAAPVERAIMDGCTHTGVAIMQMEAGLDTGPVALEAAIEIGPEMNAGEVFAELQARGVEALCAALDMHEVGVLSFTPQDDTRATYAHKITAADRVLDPAAMSAQQLHNTTRALAPHIGAWLDLDGQRFTIWSTSIVDTHELSPGEIRVEDGRLLLGCSSGAVVILHLQPPGKRRMEADAWARGQRELPSRAARPALGAS